MTLSRHQHATVFMLKSNLMTLRATFVHSTCLNFSQTGLTLEAFEHANYFQLIMLLRVLASYLTTTTVFTTIQDMFTQRHISGRIKLKLVIDTLIVVSRYGLQLVHFSPENAVGKHIFRFKLPSSKSKHERKIDLKPPKQTVFLFSSECKHAQHNIRNGYKETTLTFFLRNRSWNTIDMHVETSLNLTQNIQAMAKPGRYFTSAMQNFPQNYHKKNFPQIVFLVNE